MTARRASVGALVAVAAWSLTRSAAAAVELKPYGLLVATYVQAWGRANAVDVPAYAASGGSLGASSQDTAAFTARQSRLGLNVVGGRGPMDSALGGTIEADFFGLRNSASSNLDSLASAPRLRLAFIEAKRGDDAVLFGQDWTKALAPLNPASLLHVGAPALSQSGNLWNRDPQLRWDRTWKLSGEWSAGTRLALVRAFTGDQSGRTSTVTGTTFAVPSAADAAGSGEFAAEPAWQAQAEVRRTIEGRTFSAGLSTQYLRQSFNAAVPPPAGAANGDASGWLWSAHVVAPALERLDLSGEAFYGRGDQGLNGLGTVFNDQGSVRQTLTRGGWAQATLKPADGWRLNAMAGYEKVDRTGLAAGALYCNQTAAVNAMWDASPELTLSLEYGRIQSFYVAAMSGDSQSLGLAAQLKF